MARITGSGRRLFVAAESGAEEALLAHGEASGGIHLDGARYTVAGGRLAIPPAQGLGGAARIQRALEAAALAHAEALRRRRAFRLL